LLVAWVEFCAFSDRMFGNRNRRTMERRKTLWLACKVQTERISCLLPSMQLWLQSGTRWAERRYQTFCHWKHRTQPRLPATLTNSVLGWLSTIFEVIPHFRVSWYLSSFYPSSQN
jgi:hypothetical protein